MTTNYPRDFIDIEEIRGVEAGPIQLKCLYHAKAYEMCSMRLKNEIITYWFITDHK